MAEITCVSSRSMNRQQADVEARQSFPHLEIKDDEYEGQLNTDGVSDDGSEEDGIDLEGYEEYLEHLKSKVAVRPCSARMANAVNPVPTRPVRPVSARPRMRSTPRNPPSDLTMNGSQSCSSGGGIRRKRRSEKLVHARIRAVYNDVGRFSLPLEQGAASYSAASVNSKSKVFQEAEMHDEYYRLLDAETELKAACLQEQQKRVKAIARVRRLEEIIGMKDKKIESLLHGKAVGGGSRAVAQREIAERDRQFHALAQKLRQKISQQSQLLSSYEEAMQSLRTGMKNTNLMELEEERSQLYQELSHHQELSNRQRLDWESLQQKLLVFAEAEASNNFHITRLQQENKVISHENRKLEQEVGFLKSRVELLQNNLALEQRKRTYDREFSDSVGKHTSSSPTQKMMLAQALEEMKRLVRRESIASIRREKLKSPKPATAPARPDKSIYPAPMAASSTVLAAFSVPKTPNRITLSSPSHPRPVSAAPTRLSGTTVRQAPRKPPISDSSHNALDTVVQADKQSTESFADEQNDVDSSDTDAGCAGTIAILDASTGKQEQISLTTAFHSCSPEAYPGRGQQFGCVQVTQAVDESASDQITDEEMAEMQQKQLAAAESALRLDVDDEIDSESSADLLDDAQHPILRSEAETPSSDDAVVLVMQAAPMSPTIAEDAALDDLYPFDFLDTDAQASGEDEEDSAEAA